MRRPLLVRRAWLICAVLSAVPRSARFRRIASQRWEKTTAVAVKIKLKRLGKIREPYYRIVVADARTKRDGRAIEEIGKYHPKAEPSLIEVNSERVQHWLSVGAQPTDPDRARTRRSASRPRPRRARPARRLRKAPRRARSRARRPSPPGALRPRTLRPRTVRPRTVRPRTVQPRTRPRPPRPPGLPPPRARPPPRRVAPTRRPRTRRPRTRSPRTA